MKCTFIPLLLAAILYSQFVQAIQTGWQQAEHIQVRLLSSVNSAESGKTFLLGLHLKPEKDWHVYWQNPGDSGMPISINFDATTQLTIEKLIWPIPHKIPFGDLTNFGYEGEIIIPLKAQLNDATSNAINIQATANWLVCKETCIPGSAEFELPLPLGQNAKPSQNSEMIAHYADQEARTLPLMQGSIKEHKDKDKNSHIIELFAQTQAFKEVKNVEFFPINESLFDSSAKTQLKWKNNYLSLQQKKSDSFYQYPSLIQGLLVMDDQAWEFSFKTQTP